MNKNFFATVQVCPLNILGLVVLNTLESLCLHLFHPSQLKVYKPSEIKKIPSRNDLGTSQKKNSETTRELSLIYLPLISIVLIDQKICSNSQGDKLEDPPFGTLWDLLPHEHI